MPGLSGSFTLDAAARQYTMACPGGKTAATGVSPSAARRWRPADDPRLQAAVTGYQRYVETQAASSSTRVEPFVAAVKAGDVEKAKALFAAARAPYETIEPVAESFGNLDPEIDARVNDVEKGDKWTGFHRIEQALWVQEHDRRAWSRSPTSCSPTCSTLQAKTGR